MHIRILFFGLLLLSLTVVNAQQQLPKISLSTFSSGFTRPVDISHIGDSNLYITEQDGRVYIIDANGVVNSDTFLDIDALNTSTGNEQGLLGLTFHPLYASNGFLYVNYTDNSGNTKISRFSRDLVNPQKADPASELVIYTANQPFSNHNGGGLKFGPDGYLYFGLGDGGSANDPGNRAQDRMNKLGKMMRIDVNQGSPYVIPISNPFVNDTTTLDEIWALGLRNPWRFSFDRQTGDLWIGDVGQDDWEEIDFQPANSAGGENYGWRCYEGNVAFNTNGCSPMANYESPVYVYNNNFSTGCSVTGGFVYRGNKYPLLFGHYLFTDYCTGIIWSTSIDSSGNFQTNMLGDFSNFQYSSFGENAEGELFLAALGSGQILQIEEVCSKYLSTVALSVDTLTATLDPGLLSGTTFQWYLNDTLILGATNQNYIAPQGGDYYVVISNASDGCDVYSDTINVNVVGISELKQKDVIEIYPNPFTEETKIIIPDSEQGIYTLSVMDLQGKVVFSRSNIQEKEIIFNRGLLKAGMYLIEVVGKNVYRGRVILK